MRPSSPATCQILSRAHGTRAQPSSDRADPSKRPPAATHARRLWHACLTGSLAPPIAQIHDRVGPAQLRRVGQRAEQRERVEQRERRVRHPQAAASHPTRRSHPHSTRRHLRHPHATGHTPPPHTPPPRSRLSSHTPHTLPPPTRYHSRARSAAVHASSHRPPSPPAAHPCHTRTHRQLHTPPPLIPHFNIT